MAFNLSGLAIQDTFQRVTHVTGSNSQANTLYFLDGNEVYSLHISSAISASYVDINKSLYVSQSLGVGTNRPEYELQVMGDAHISGALEVRGSQTIDGNMTVGGTMTAQEFHTEFVSSSIMYDSGSTKFGDTTDDEHNITGSLLLTGSLNINKTITITGISNDTTFADSSQVEVPTEYAIQTYSDERDNYLRKQFVKVASSLIGDSTASFSAVTASAPTGMTATGENDFLFFINGQYIEHNAMGIEQTGSLFYLLVDTDNIGYTLENTDEIIAWGKFNA